MISSVFLLIFEKMPGLEGYYEVMPYKVPTYLHTPNLGHFSISSLGSNFTKIAFCFQHLLISFSVPEIQFPSIAID